MDAVVVGPGELRGVAELDLVAGGEDGVKCVSGFVRGIQDKLGEADAFQAVEEIGRVLLRGVIQLEVEVAME